MTKEEKAYKILKAFHDLVHADEEGRPVVIHTDWGSISLTIKLPNGDHYHFGDIGEERLDGFATLIDELYNHFCE